MEADDSVSELRGAITSDEVTSRLSHVSHFIIKKIILILILIIKYNIV